jgi:two-component system sensor histidine kinase/response regulator
MQNLFLYQKFIENELDFSDCTQVNILNSFSNVMQEIQKRHKNSEERIDFKIEESNVEISKKHLDFILFEVIENALKFSDQKIITIFGNLFDSNYYKLLIKDFGIGFNSDELIRIDAGQQFNREKREQQGLGLGLFLSKNILKKSNGIFTIISEENSGTEISLYFPLYKN